MLSVVLLEEKEQKATRYNCELKKGEPNSTRQSQWKQSLLLFSTHIYTVMSYGFALCLESTNLKKNTSEPGKKPAGQDPVLQITDRIDQMVI